MPSSTSPMSLRVAAWLRRSPTDGRGLPQAAQSGVGPILAQVGPTQVVEDPSLAGREADFGEDGPRLFQRVDGVIETPQIDVGLAQVVQGNALAVPVAGLSLQGQ